MKRLFALALSALIALAPGGSPLRAQDPPDAAAQQQAAEARFRELGESMQRLHAFLSKAGEQDELKILRAGMTLAQEKRIEQAMGQIRTLLDQQKWDAALERMQGVRADLVQLLEVLQNRNLDLRKLLERLAQLEGFRGEVDRLAKEQAAEKEASARAEELQRQLAAIQAAKAAAEKLLSEQQELRARTNALGLEASAAAAKPLADKEGELKQSADQLEKELQRIDEQAKGEASAASAARAASAMQQAKGQLEQQRAEPSLKDQDQAIAELRSTTKRLEEMADEARRELEKLPFDQQARRQEDTKNATDTLAQQMEQAEQEAEDGEPTPGRKSVQQAVPKQKAAAGQLKEYKPAKQKQQDAKEDLEQARDELDEAINQLRQQLQDETLRALEERFTAMLAKQRELSLQTKTLDRTRKQTLTADGALPASLKERIQAVATGEQDLEVEASDALKLIEEEGTTAVFPEIVRELKSQLHGVAKDCRANETDEALQQRQAEVEDTLTLLINALRKTIENRENGQC